VLSRRLSAAGFLHLEASMQKRFWRRTALGLITSGLLTPGLQAQLPPQPVPPPPMPGAQPALPPLLFVRIDGPKGMKATFFRGTAKGQTVEAPAVVGLRPGYTYRVGLSDVPDHPGRTYYPTLEVRASLYLGNRLRNADFPATLKFSSDDFTRAEAGAMIRKVVVLERPDLAIPLPSRADEPIEVPVPITADPMVAALDRGQPLVLVQMGQREWTAQELAFAGVGGTVLMPGEKALAPPRFPPWVPWGCFLVVDPMTGPVDPEPYNCIPDGGDSGMPIGFGPDGKLRGVDPSDTVAEYSDSKGRRRLVVSNRVCLCIPRFIITRGETLPLAEVALIGLGKATVTNGYDVVANQQTPLVQSQNVMLETAAQKQRPSGIANQYGTVIVGRLHGLEIKTSLRTVHEVDGMCLRPEEPALDLPLRIIKWPDKAGAQIGEVVTFTLRYTNRGGQPIADVVVTDNLAPRFEYVAGSAKADHAAIFTVQPNDVGSTILRWQINGVLQPHESGTVTFQVRVR
jgi:uncharacterized repeat protein (TIGR01451 family)